MVGFKACCLCGQIAGCQDGDLISCLLRESMYTRRIALESNNFAVIPSLGGITRGHVLICPKDHVRSYAEFFTRTADLGNAEPIVSLREEFTAIKAQTIDMLRAIFEAPVHLFEHGSAPEGSKAVCTVDHAHLHAVPANVDIVSILIREAGWMKVECSLDLFLKEAFGHEYIYYESPDGMKLAANRNETHASQYLRQVFTSALKSTYHWNWRYDPRPKQADEDYQTMIRFRSV